MAEEVLVVMTTWPDVETARAAARVLIEERLAACANLVPQVESIYRWEWKIQTSSEVMMVLKTTTWRYPLMEARIMALHSYKVPEIVCLRVTEGLPAYLSWVEQGCLPGR